MTSISFFVDGIPQPQGSKSACVIPPKDLITTLNVISRSNNPRKTFFQCVKAITKDANEDKLRPWRKQVSHEAKAAMRGEQIFSTAVDVEILFILPRPKFHYRTGKFSHLLRGLAPVDPSGKPDVDKLQRAIFDSMSKIVFDDDSQVCKVTAEKIYVRRDHRTPGIQVTVSARPSLSAEQLEFEPELEPAKPF